MKNPNSVISQKNQAMKPTHIHHTRLPYKGNFNLPPRRMTNTRNLHLLRPVQIYNIKEQSIRAASNINIFAKRYKVLLCENR